MQPVMHYYPESISFSHSLSLFHKSIRKQQAISYIYNKNEQNTWTGHAQKRE